MQDVPKGCMMLRKGRTGPPIVSASVDCSLLPLSHLQASTLPALQLIDDALAAHPGLAQTLRKGIWRSTSSSLQGADGHSQAVAPGAAASSSSGSAGGARQGTGPAASDQAAVQSTGENCGQATAAAIEKAAQGNGLEAAAVLQQVLEIAFSWLAFEMQVRASTHLIRRPANGLFWLLGACLVAAPGCQPCAQLAGVISKRISPRQGLDIVQAGSSSSAPGSCMSKFAFKSCTVFTHTTWPAKIYCLPWTAEAECQGVCWHPCRALQALRQLQTCRPRVDIFLKAAHQAPRLT